MARVAFAIPGDFTSAGGVPPTPNKLNREIRAAGTLSAIFTGLVINRTLCVCEFTVAPDLAQVTTLNGVITAHVPDTPAEAKSETLDELLTEPIHTVWDATAFDQENRLRVLEGVAPLTARQFRDLLGTRFP